MYILFYILVESYPPFFINKSLIVHLINDYVNSTSQKLKTWILSVVDNFITCKLCSEKFRWFIYNQMHKKIYKEIGEDIENGIADNYDLLGRLVRFCPSLLGKIIIDTKNLEYNFASIIISCVKVSNLFVRSLAIGYYEVKTRNLVKYINKYYREYGIDENSELLQLLNNDNVCIMVLMLMKMINLDTITSVYLYIIIG